MLGRLLKRNRSLSSRLSDKTRASAQRGHFRLQCESLENRLLLTAFFDSIPFSTIQEAIDAAASNPGDDVVEIAEGLYLEQLRINDSSGALVLRGLGSVPSRVEIQPIQPFNSNVIDAVLTNPVTIQNLRVSSGENGINAVGFATGLVSENATATGELMLDDVESIKNSVDGLHVKDSSSVRVLSSLFDGNDGDGMELLNVGDVDLIEVVATNNDPGLLVESCSVVTIAGGNFSDNANHGILVIDCAGDVTITDIVAHDNDANNDGIGDGLRLIDGDDLDDLAIGGTLRLARSDFGDTDGQENAKHQENGISVPRGRGVGGIGGDVRMVDTTATGNDTDGVRILLAHGGASISGGSFSHNRDRGLSLARMGNVSVKGVSGDANGLQGLDLDVVASAHVRNSNFSENGNDGIDIDLAGGVSIVRSTTFANGDHGVELEQVDDVRLRRVRADDNVGAGVFIEDATRVNMVSVVAHRNETGAVIDTATLISADRISLLENANHGLQVIDIATNARIRHVVSSNNDADGDGVGDGLFATARDAVFAIGGDLILGNAEFRDTDGAANAVHQEFGVDIPLIEGTGGVGGDLRFRNVQAVANDADGLRILRAGGNTSVVNSVFSENRDRGLRLARMGDVSVRNVDAEHNRLQGVDFDVVGRVSINRVTASGNGDDGIDIDFAADVHVAWVRALDNGDNGIELESVDNVSIRRSLMRNNSNNGLYISQADDVDIEWSVFLRNGVDGMRVDYAGTITIKNSVSILNGSGDHGLHAVCSGPVIIISSLVSSILEVCPVP